MPGYGARVVGYNPTFLDQAVGIGNSCGLVLNGASYRLSELADADWRSARDNADSAEISSRGSNVADYRVDNQE